MVPVALMAALTAVGAQLRIPLPYVPITLQAAFVCLAGLLLGSWRGAASQAVYLTAGLVGLPVFAGGGGLHYLLKPSAGYLLGFVAGAWLAGRLAGEAQGLTFRRASLSSSALAPLPKDLLVGLLVAWLAVRLRPVMGSPAG